MSTATALLEAVRTVNATNDWEQAAKISGDVLTYFECLERHNHALDLNSCVQLCESHFPKELYTFFSRCTYLFRTGSLRCTPPTATFLVTKHLTVPICEAFLRPTVPSLLDFNIHIGPQLITLLKVAEQLRKDAGLLVETTQAVNAVANAIARNYSTVIPRKTVLAGFISGLMVTVFQELQQAVHVFDPQLGARFCKSALSTAESALFSGTCWLGSLFKMFVAVTDAEEAQTVNAQAAKFVKELHSVWKAVLETLTVCRHSDKPKLVSVNAPLMVAPLLIFGLFSDIHDDALGGVFEGSRAAAYEAALAVMSCAETEAAVKVVVSSRGTLADMYEAVESLALSAHKAILTGVHEIRDMLRGDTVGPGMWRTCSAILDRLLQDIGVLMTATLCRKVCSSPPSPSESDKGGSGDPAEEAGWTCLTVVSMFAELVVKLAQGMATRTADVKMNVLEERAAELMPLMCRLHDMAVDMSSRFPLCHHALPQVKGHILAAIVALIKQNQELKAEDLIPGGYLHSFLDHDIVRDSIPPLIALRGLTSLHIPRFLFVIPPPTILVDRAQLLDSSMHELDRELFTRDPAQLRYARVLFKGETAGGPGVLREWLTLVSKSLFHPQCGLFASCLVNTRAVHLSPASSIQPRHYMFAGKVLALALLKEVPLYFHLSSSVYKCLLGHPVDLKDMHEIDPTKASSYQSILDMDQAHTLEMTFSTEYVNGSGQRRTQELLPGGEQLPVTDGNKDQFIQLMLEWELHQKMTHECAAFRRGFLTLFPGIYPFHYLSHSALNQLIGGQDTIDVSEWIPFINFHGWPPGPKAEPHPVTTWFLDTLRSMNQDELSRLLHFWCGISSLPLGGFKTLDKTFQVARLHSLVGRLPQAHTCVFQLLIPEYNSPGDLHRGLRVAIDNCAGYGML